MEGKGKKMYERTGSEVERKERDWDSRRRNEHKSLRKRKKKRNKKGRREKGRRGKENEKERIFWKEIQDWKEFE